MLQGGRPRRGAQDPVADQLLHDSRGGQVIGRRQVEGCAQGSPAVEGPEHRIDLVGQLGQPRREPFDVHGELRVHRQRLGDAGQLLHAPHGLQQRALRPPADAALPLARLREVDAKLAVLPGHQPPERDVAGNGAQLGVDDLALAHPDARELPAVLAAHDRVLPPALQRAEEVQQPQIPDRAGERSGRPGIGEASPLEQVPHALHQLLEEDRLREVVVGPRLDRPRLRGRVRSADEQEGDPRQPLVSPGRPAERDSVRLRQPHLAHRGLDGGLEQFPHRLPAVRGRLHRETCSAQRELEDMQAPRVAVRDQHRLPGHQPFRFPKSKPERTPPPPFGCFPRRCSISRISSAASG